jgi:predicted 3-demethylubiquinone-9 3-methyltransferase (glyoxalase superfamily)
MFQGNAEKAMKFYVSLFPDAEVLDVVRYGPNEPGVEGSTKKGRVSIGGQSIIFIDSTVKHDFSFTPAFSFFVECKSDEEIGYLHSELSAGGTVFMPLGDHGFSRKFAWIGDQFGVSWQLNLA